MAFAKVTKAVFPVAGLGSRFLPATKASPKEMLPIVDKPLIQYAVEEAAAAGITDMIFITGRNKRAIEDHFDKAYELETELAARDKHALLEMVQAAAPPGINCIYIRQSEALGLGHAVLCAEPVVGNEPFAVLLADDLIDAKIPVTRQMVDVARREGASTIGVMNVPAAEIGSWGIVEAGSRSGGRTHQSHPAHGREAQARERRHRRSRWSGVTSCRRAYFITCAPCPPGAGGRDPVDRRHRAPAGGRTGRRLRVRGPALRLRQQARLSRGNRRARRSSIRRSAQSSRRFSSSTL